MPSVYVGVGSNLGCRKANLEQALSLMGSAGFRILRRSDVYETEPVGIPGAPRFLNQVILARTELSPSSVLNCLKSIEIRMGRTDSSDSPISKERPDPTPRHRENQVEPPKQSRVIDLDLLLYGRRVIRTPRLVVPHPRLHTRAFVLVPLCDIAPNVVHPVEHCRIRTLLSRVDCTGVRRLEN